MRRGRYGRGLDPVIREEASSGNQFVIYEWDIFVAPADPFGVPESVDHNYYYCMGVELVVLDKGNEFG
jgi:hypothetical protein